MSLVYEHCLSIINSLVVVIVVKGGGGRSTANYRAVGLNTAALILLFAICFKDTLKVTLSHPVSDLSQYFYVTLDCDFCGPAHNIYLLRCLGDTGISKDLIHDIFIDTFKFFPILLFRYHVFHS
jgi:hypothetical protein